MKTILLLITFIIPLLANTQTNYLQKALQAEQWIHSLQQEDNHGIYWPNIKDSTDASTELYSGNSGVILFYLELYHTTKNKNYLSVIDKAIQHILSTLPSRLNDENTGLYTGTAGIAYMLHQASVITGNKSYAVKSKELLQQLPAVIFTGDSTDNIANDIVYGYAGIGLTFLYAAKYQLNEKSLQMATAIGDTLLNRKVAVANGIRWPMFINDTARKFYMPNFSHGTAGVAYFLSCLYEQTKNKKYLDAALQAADYLQSIAAPNGFVYHAEPNKEAMQRYYLSWCHGPAGTARLYYKLYQLTKEIKWKQLVGQLASNLSKCGIPEKRTNGFWNNVSYCCGNAGIAEFYLQLYEVYKNKNYLHFGKHMTDDLVNRSVANENGLQWPQAEHRSQPQLIQSQTGLMQGAAGIGLVLLHLYSVENKKHYSIKLPDNPF